MAESKKSAEWSVDMISSYRKHLEYNLARYGRAFKHRFPFSLEKATVFLKQQQDENEFLRKKKLEIEIGDLMILPEWEGITVSQYIDTEVPSALKEIAWEAVQICLQKDNPLFRTAIEMEIRAIRRKKKL